MDNNDAVRTRMDSKDTTVECKIFKFYILSFSIPISFLFLFLDAHDVGHEWEIFTDLADFPNRGQTETVIDGVCEFP
jgi:hypothetical protein